MTVLNKANLHKIIFLVSFWVHDMDSVKKKITFVTGLFVFDLILILVFGVILGWI